MTLHLKALQRGILVGAEQKGPIHAVTLNAFFVSVWPLRLVKRAVGWLWRAGLAPREA